MAIANSNVPNMVGQISTCLAAANLNIADLLNKSRGELAYTLIDTDGERARSGPRQDAPDRRRAGRAPDRCMKKQRGQSAIRAAPASRQTPRRNEERRRRRRRRGDRLDPRAHRRRRSRSIHALHQRARALRAAGRHLQARRGPHRRLLPAGARSAGAAHGARAQQGPAARRGDPAAVPRDHVGLPGAAGAAEGRLPRARGHVHAAGGAQALRSLGARAAADLDRRGVPRSGGRRTPTSASCRSRTRPRARSTTRSTCS